MVPPKIRANDDVSESAIAAGMDEDMEQDLPTTEGRKPDAIRERRRKKPPPPCQ
jgi:hypothetical protein